MTTPNVSISLSGLNDQRNGIYTQKIPIADESGSILIESTYERDKLHGVRRRYYVPIKTDSKRQLLREENYNQGLMTQSIDYYPNNFTRIDNWFTGMLNGTSLILYPNGLVFARLDYRNDIPFGQLQYYNLDGYRVALFTVRNGCIVGPYTIYAQGSTNAREEGIMNRVEIKDVFNLGPEILRPYKVNIQVYSADQTGDLDYDSDSENRD